MADQICRNDIPVEPKFKLKSKDLQKLEVPTLSGAKDADERLGRISGKHGEVLARGQKISDVDAGAIRLVRRLLNVALYECAPLDENSGVFDKEMQQRVALFQKTYVANDSRFGGNKEIDGVVGRNTLIRLQEVNREQDEAMKAMLEGMRQRELWDLERKKK